MVVGRMKRDHVALGLAWGWCLKMNAIMYWSVLEVQEIEALGWYWALSMYLQA